MPTPTELGLNKEVWLAVRTDGLPGAGTAEDPFDASTRVKFDTLMASFGSYTTIHLAPGTYETRGKDVYFNRAAGTDGAPEWVVLSGWKILGAGIGVTTIKLVINATELFNGGDTGHGYCIFSKWAVPTDDVTIKDLTLDLNWDNLDHTFKLYTAGIFLGGNYTSDVVYTQGHRILIEDVRIIHAGTDSVLTEMFICTLNTADNSWMHRVTIDEMSAHSVGGMTMMSVGFQKNTRCRISECHLDGSFSGTPDWTNPQIGFSLHGPQCVLECNTVNGVAFAGPYHDTGYCDEIIVRNNHFMNVTVGAYIFQNASGAGKLVFENNIIELIHRPERSANYTAIGIQASGVGYTAPPYNITQAIVRGNTVRYGGVIPAGCAAKAIGLISVERLVMEDNLIDLPAQTGVDPLFYGPAASLSFHNNRTIAGAQLAAWNYATSQYGPFDSYINDTLLPIATRVTGLEQNISSLRTYCKGIPATSTTTGTTTPTRLHPDWIGTGKVT